LLHPIAVEDLDPERIAVEFSDLYTRASHRILNAQSTAYDHSLLAIAMWVFLGRPILESGPVLGANATDYGRDGHTDKYPCVVLHYEASVMTLPVMAEP